MLRCSGRRDLRFLLRFRHPFPRVNCSSSVAIVEAEFDFPSSLCSSSQFGGVFQEKPHSFHDDRFFRADPKDYRILGLRNCHALARHGRLKETRNVLRHIIEKEGDAHSLFEKLAKIQFFHTLGEKISKFSLYCFIYFFPFRNRFGSFTLWIVVEGLPELWF